MYIVYIVIFYSQPSCIAHEETAICHLPSKRQFSQLVAMLHYTEYQYVNTYLCFMQEMAVSPSACSPPLQWPHYSA